MRSLAFGWTVVAAVLGLASGCGQSEGDSATPGGAGNGAMTAGSSSAGASASNAGTSATAGTASGGSSSGGASHGGGTAGGASGAAPTTGGQAGAQAGAGSNGGGAGGLVDCDPKKISCKRAAPVCGAGQVPSVDGSCYGDCVKVAQCACTAADQCPQPNEYTCWAKQHCGPFVR